LIRFREETANMDITQNSLLSRPTSRDYLIWGIPILPPEYSIMENTLQSIESKSGPQKNGGSILRRRKT